jgi:hypothetical protein
MVTTWPRNFPGLGVGAQRLADRITAATDGQLTIQVFTAGEMVPPLQSLDAVIDGSAEMSHGAAYYWQNKSVGLSFFTGVPFGMTSRELAAWVRYLGGQEIWDEIYDQFGVQGFLSGDTGTQAGGWFRNELTGIDDVQGLRFRTPGLGGQVWQKMGASVTNLAGGRDLARRCSPARSTRPSSSAPTTIWRSASTRCASTTTPRPSSSRAWRPNWSSTRPSSRRCRRTCRRSSRCLPGRIRPGRVRLLRQRSARPATLVNDHDVITHPELPRQHSGSRRHRGEGILTEIREQQRP